MANDGPVTDPNIEDLTLKDLLTLTSADVPNPEVAAGVDSEDFRTLQKQLSVHQVPIAWSAVQAEIAGVLSATLNTSLLTIWARAWEKYRGLMDDVEQSRKSPDAVVPSPLAEHSIDSTLRPYLEIFLGPKKIQKIPFDVTLTTQIKGLILGLKNAHIMSLQFAECEWTGAIGVNGVTLVRRGFGKLTLPGRIELKSGIPLGASPGA
jgi:hypothetical protein